MYLHFSVFKVFFFIGLLTKNSLNINMPRENRITRTARLTRSGRRDPSWETIVFLQESVKKLTRQLRRGEQTRRAIGLELQKVKEELEWWTLSFSLGTLRTLNQEVELENSNLRNRIRFLEGLLDLDGDLPPPLDRTFSSLEL
jgi:hypothetical protein